MRKIELMKISLIAGVMLFFLLSIAAACETAKCVKSLNNADNSLNSFMVQENNNK